ncbi:hypothetical protein J2W58_003906 [Pseudomonas psychrotolerans]|nr:hypothetical protein [Pseudomonas psychrotolerans]
MGWGRPSPQPSPRGRGGGIEGAGFWYALVGLGPVPGCIPNRHNPDQDPMHRADGRHRYALILQSTRQLACPQAGCCAHMAMTCAFRSGAQRPGDVTGRCERSISASPAQARASHLHAVVGLMPKRRYSKHTFAPACRAKSTNSSRNAIVDLSCHGIGLLTSASEQVFTMSPDHTLSRREKGLSEFNQAGRDCDRSYKHGRFRRSGPRPR